MEFNRIVSLALGFIVLVLVFVWIGGRFRSSTNETTNKAVISQTPTPTNTKEQEKGWNPLGFLFSGASTTPSIKTSVTTTPTIISKPTTSEGYVVVTTAPTTIVYQNNKTGQTSQYDVSGIQQIPQTGVSTVALPIAITLLSAGIYLKKKTS